MVISLVLFAYPHTGIVIHQGTAAYHKFCILKVNNNSNILNVNKQNNQKNEDANNQLNMRGRGDE